MERIKLKNGLTKCILKNGDIKYRNKKGKLHRTDGPAFTTKVRIPYVYGRYIHRTWGLPKNALKRIWFINGEIHREDGHAVWCANGTKMWFQNGKPHRENGPAILTHDGDKKWFVNGILHREDGPACEFVSGSQQWWINGELHREDGPAIIDDWGNKSWYKNGELHREDGPAHVPAPTWHLNDVEVPEHAVMAPETITLEDIQTTDNWETKRVLRELYGEGRYLQGIKAKIIDCDVMGVSQVDFAEDRAVPRMLVEDDDEERFLVGTDGSTGRVYYMQVPRTCETCGEAHNALAGFDESRIVSQS